MLGSLPDVDVGKVAELQWGDDAVVNDYFMYVFKVQPCPKRGAHDWSSCPYAHPKEKARRRDPRVYKYASTPCPESLKGMSCGRGVDCPYAHSVYEYWLHPNRFRTQMCKKGNQCNRTLCFFAHSASELRFPDTDDAEVAAAVDAAAASASATPLPLCQPALGQQQQQQQHALAYGAGSGSGLMALPAASGGSAGSLPLPAGLNLLNLGHMCDASSTGSGYCMVRAGLGPVQGGVSRAPLRQTSMSLVSQDEGYAGPMHSSDPGMRLPRLAGHVPEGHAGLSEPLPRLGAGENSAAWLQLAAASQLPASQVLSSIRPPGHPVVQLMAAQAPSLHSQQHHLQMQAVAMLQQQQMAAAAAAQQQQQQQRVAAAAAQQQVQQQRQMAAAAAQQQVQQQQQMQRVAASSHGLANKLAALNLQGGGVADDSSGSSCITSVSGDPAYLAAALNAAAVAAGGAQGAAQYDAWAYGSACRVGGSPAQQQQQQRYAQHKPGDAPAASQGMPAGSNSSSSSSSSRVEDFLLLQQLQQQQLIRLGSGGQAVAQHAAGAAAPAAALAGAYQQSGGGGGLMRQPGSNNWAGMNI